MTDEQPPTLHVDASPERAKELVDTLFEEIQRRNQPREEQARRINTIVFGCLAIFGVALTIFATVRHGSRSPETAVGYILLVVFGSLAVSTWRSKARHTLDARDVERIALAPNIAKESRLQRSAVDDQLASLQRYVSGQVAQTWLFYTLTLGFLLSAGLGPFLSLKALNAKPDYWPVVVPGTTWTLLMLASAFAMLRTAHKRQEQVNAALPELRYFQRVQTGLDCALSLGPSMYRDGLEKLTAYLLAPPPLLSAPKAVADDKGLELDPAKTLESLLAALATGLKK